MLKFIKSRKSNSKRVEWMFASDIKKRINKLVAGVNIDWIRTSGIYCFRSINSKTRARARIWGLSRVWQMALNTKPAYIIEVISEKFDNLSQHEQDQILLHELAHIPKNFSGSLLPHIRYGKRSFRWKVDELITRYIQSKKEEKERI